MRRLAKVGLTAIAAGALLVALPFVRYNYPTHVPLTTKLPLAAESTLSQEFKVRTSERYNLQLACIEGGKLSYSASQFLSSNPTNKPHLDCNISMRISQSGREIFSTNLTSLRPAMMSADALFWHLGYVQIPNGGKYLLELTNHGELYRLRENDPTVKMDIGGVFYVSAIYSKMIGAVAGGLIAFVGLIVFLFGLRKKNLDGPR